MAYKTPNYTKANFQADIKKKQMMWSRMKRRYRTSKNLTERKFLKAEATRLCTDLRQYSKKWQTWGFGGYTWITKNFSATNFVAGATTYTTGARKTTVARKSPTRKAYGRKSTRTTSYRSPTTRSRNTSRTRSSAVRRTRGNW